MGAMREMPFGLKAVCIMAILFGIMGVLSGGFGLLGLFLKQDRAATGNAAQIQFNERLQEHAKKMRPIQLVLVPSALAASVLLLAAGISGLKLEGLGLLRIAFAASLLIDSIAAAYGISAQLKMMDLMEDFFRSGGADTPVLTGMKVGVRIGLTFAVGWMLAKIGFYVGSLVFLGKRAVRDAFLPPAAPVGSAPQP
jgi:hypothetical protein